MRETHVERILISDRLASRIDIAIKQYETRALPMLRKNGWRGVRRKAHSITDLWLLDAPVASEINARVYMYSCPTCCGTTGSCRARSFASLLFYFSINHLCIFETVFISTSTRAKVFSVANNRAIDNWDNRIGLQLINIYVFYIFHIKTSTLDISIVYIYMYIFVNSFINSSDRRESSYANCARNVESFFIFMLRETRESSFFVSQGRISKIIIGINEQYYY